VDNPDLRAQSATFYAVDTDSIDYATGGDRGQITATLNLGSTTDGKAAQTLSLSLTFY